MPEPTQPQTSEFNRLFDAATQLKDAYLVASSEASQVSAANQIVDVGLGWVRFDHVIDVSAIEIATGDELYSIYVEGSTSPTFASDIADLCVIELGAAGAKRGDQDVADTVGRYVVPGSNVRHGITYRYVRGYTLVAGTIATGINYDSYLSMRA